MSANISAQVGEGYVFPYNVEDAYETKWGLWTHHKGSSKNNCSPVSIFKYTAKDINDNRIDIARNAVKRLQLLRHPNILSFKDAAELQEDGALVLYLVTEAARPLEFVLNTLDLDDSHKHEYLAIGLYQVASALSFLNNDCNSIHGNICLNAVVVTDTLDWKLHGFHLLSKHHLPSNFPLQHHAMLMENKYKPPELDNEEWDTVRQSPPWAIDAWGLGCLIWEVFSGCALIGAEELRTTEDIPPALSPDVQGLLNPNPSCRSNPAQLTQNEFFNNPLVDVVLFLENIAAKDPADKDRFFETLPSVLPSIPTSVCVAKILPLLASALETGAAPAAAVKPLLLTGSSLDQDAFVEKMAPCLSKLSTSSDPDVRTNVLESMGQYGRYLTTPVVLEEQPPLPPQTHSQDTEALNPELTTVKATLAFAPEPTQKTWAQCVVQVFSNLQVKSWMAAWTSGGGYPKALPPMVLLLALLALVSAVLLLAFHPFPLSGVSHTADTARLCPAALLDGLQDLEFRLGHVLSNLTSGDPALPSMPACDADADGYCSNVDSTVALRPQWPGLPEDCTPFCERLTNDLQSTNDMMRALTEATSTRRSERCCETFPFVLVFMVVVLPASLFSLAVVVLVGSSKAHASGSGSAIQAFLDGVSQIYKTGTSKFAEVCGQETICPSPELLDELQKLRSEKYELSAAALELATLQKEVDELRGIEASLERVKADHQQLKATELVVKDLEEENAELAVKASELDAVTSSNAELRNSVAKVLELQSQNQQLQPIASLLESVSANHEQLQQAASRVLDLQSQNQQLQATANLYDNVKAANVNLQQLVAQVVELEAQNQQLRATAALLDLVKAANAELLEAATQVHELQTQNQQLQATASMLDQTRAVNAQLREMVLQVQELQAQNRQLQASASFLHSVKALNADLQDRMVQVQRLQRGSLASSMTSPKDSLVLRDQEPRSSTPQTPSSIHTSPHSHDSDCGRNRVFIGGLAASVDEQSLAGCFEKYGTVLGTKVVRSAKGQQSRGYGFVTFQLPEHADMAVDAVKDMMALLKPKEPGCYERLTIDYSTSSHMD